MSGGALRWTSCLLATLAVASVCAAEDPPRVRHFRSLREIREQNVVRQRWDMSCGSAALSTVLTYDLQQPTRESEVVIWLLRRTDPVKIQARGGFSLLDLKRFAISRGNQAEAYAELSLQELADLHQPAIVPIRVKGYDHFIVFRGITGDRVRVADPAFGTMTMTAARFTALWKNGVAFVILPRAGIPPLQSAQITVPDAGSLYRTMLNASIGHPTRLTP